MMRCLKWANGRSIKCSSRALATWQGQGNSGTYRNTWPSGSCRPPTGDGSRSGRVGGWQKPTESYKPTGNMGGSGGFNKQPSAPRPIDDAALVDFGKYKGMTFAAIYENDPRYCRWVVDAAKKDNNTNVEMLRLAMYVQGVLLKQSDEVSGVAGCLGSCTFVVSGRHDTVSRGRVVELIEFFGGVVRPTVTDKTSYLLVLGQTLDDWRGDAGQAPQGVTELRKYKAAQERGLPVLSGLGALFEVIRPPPIMIESGTLSKFKFWLAADGSRGKPPATASAGEGASPVTSESMSQTVPPRPPPPPRLPSI